MKDRVSVVLAGIGGYGSSYVRLLLEPGMSEKVEIAGAVDVKPEAAPGYRELKERGVPFFGSLDEFYRNNSADLAIIAVPIQLHLPLTRCALSHGSSVLCEKPVSATVQEAYEMMKARDEAGRFVAIGYQWSFSDPVLSLKKDIMKGLLGRPERLKTIVLWPRDFEYYGRSAWAGRRKDAKGGWILDSVANNATAHHLHNMLYVTGKSIDRSSVPKYVEAELYRANNIENFDTSVIRAITEDGIEITHYCSHAVRDNQGVTYCFEFENATVTYGGMHGENKPVTALFKDGTVKVYGEPENERAKKLYISMDAVRSGGDIPCGIEAALSHTLCINGAHESVTEIAEFPKNLVRTDAIESRLWVEGLAEALIDSYENWAMPAGRGITWARPGKRIDMQGYKFFKG